MKKDKFSILEKGKEQVRKSVESEWALQIFAANENFENWMHHVVQ